INAVLGAVEQPPERFHAVVRNQIAWVQTFGQRGNCEFHIAPDEDLQSTIDARLSTRIRVEHQYYFRHEPPKLPNVRFIQGGPHRRNDMSDAGLMGHQDIGVSFNNGEISFVGRSLASNIYSVK